MEELQKVFAYKGQQIRMSIKSGQPWWVAKDVCEVLDITWSGSKTLANIKDEHKGVVKLTTPGGIQKLLSVNEPGLYKLAFRSNKEEAERFTDWIAEEVLPSIRQHGAYMTPQKIEEVLLNPDTIIQLATQLKAEQEQRRMLQEQAKKDRPKVLFADSVQASKNSILIRELAVILRQNGVDIGQNRLFEWLRNNGYLVKRKGTDYNTPTQRAMDLGLFEVKETTITHADGHISISKTTKVTGKGQVYFVNKLLREQEAAV